MRGSLPHCQRQPSQVLDLEAEHMVRTMMTEDHARAAQAFVEKRAPEFRGY
jgi:1,4-dihydroxy-2-naphthoyl-CoA synthase